MPNYTCPLCGFTSTGHPTKKAAIERGREHRDEHDNPTTRED